MENFEIYDLIENDFLKIKKIYTKDKIKSHTKEEISFVRSLFNFPVHKDNAQAHAAKLAKLKLARDFKKTISLCSKDLDNITGEEDIMDLISKVESPILDATADVYQSSGNKTELIGDEIDEYLEFYFYIF